jgi:polyisoprenyl-phosphate glycosyltransferase
VAASVIALNWNYTTIVCELSRTEKRPAMDEATTQYSLSVIVPAYNEQEVLAEFQQRIASVLDTLQAKSEIIYVNDGSRDSTLKILHELREKDERVAVLNLSRNFGKEIAVTAGLDFARGDAVVVIDADLQDPPELIPEMVETWRDGYDTVFATREVREGETWLKKKTAAWFYKTAQSLSRFDIPAETGDFRLLSRKSVNALKQLREHHRFMKGLFAWIGFKQTAIRYKRDPRFAGTTKWNYWKLWNFALEGITSFTIVPLKLASYVGFIVAIGAFTYAGWIIYKTLQYGDPVAGYPSLMVAILFLGAVQLIFIGVLGEYLGRVFNESKDRPLYFVSDFDKSALGATEPQPEKPR